MKEKEKNETFWDRVKVAMKAKKMRPTQTAAASLAGRKQGTISGVWNVAGRAPEMAVVLSLSKKLGVNVEWLYTGRGPMVIAPDSDEHLDELMSVWGKLDEPTKRAIAGFAVGRASGIGQDLPFVKSSAASNRQTKSS